MYETYYQLSKLFAPTYEKSGNSVINHGTSLGEGTVEKTGVIQIVHIIGDHSLLFTKIQSVTVRILTYLLALNVKRKYL